MKAKITTNAGTFEFEGDDTAVEKQIEAVLKMSATLPKQKTDSAAPASKTKKKARNKPATVRAQPKMLTNLIADKQEVDLLRSYFTEKAPSSHIEKFAVLTLWLKNHKSTNSASVDEMWTLYKILNIRQPKNLIQTFRDGKSKKGYFELNDEGRYFITPFGETFVDHDLPVGKKGEA